MHNEHLRTIFIITTIIALSVMAFVLTASDNYNKLPKLPAPESISKININTAVWQELDLLPGIGPKKARAIAEFRSLNGSMNSLDILLESDILTQADIDRITGEVKFNDN